MTGKQMQEFEEWALKALGWGRIRLLKELEVSHRRLLSMRSGGRIPAHIAYACAAIRAGLKPYGSETTAPSV